MARTVTVSVPSDRTDDLVSELRTISGLLTLHRQDGISLQPPGDVVTVEVDDRSTSTLMGVLTKYGAGRDDGVSVTSGEPDGMVSSSGSRTLERDIASSSFEEIEFKLDREATLGVNEVIVMALAGVVAVAGLATNAVHLVVGAMVIAPGFEPFLKISLSVAGGSSWKRGLTQTAKGYGSLVAGALLGGLVMRALGTDLPAEPGSYLSEGVLVSYWRSVTPAATVVAVCGGLAGAILINANRAVLTAGVMIALALVPGAAHVGLGIAATNSSLALDGLVRWAHDAGIVVATGAVVFGALRATRGRGLRG